MVKFLLSKGGWPTLSRHSHTSTHFLIKNLLSPKSARMPKECLKMLIPKVCTIQPGTLCIPVKHCLHFFRKYAFLFSIMYPIIIFSISYPFSVVFHT